jgi:hypothetical protein
MAKIMLGQTVRDTLTGYEGIAVARTEWLHGCVRITIQAPGVTDEGKIKPTCTCDEPQCEVVKKTKVKTDKKKHGPKPDPVRR